MLNKKQTILAVAAVAVLVLIGVVASLNMKKTGNMQNTQENSSAQGYVPKVDGLQIEVLKEGSGDKVSKEGDLLVVNYVGKLEDGTVFDSSIDRNQTFSFTVGNGEVIKGWDEGLLGMKVGEKRKLTMIPELGYGNQAVGVKEDGTATIPANSTLAFEVELMEIQ